MRCRTVQSWKGAYIVAEPCRAGAACPLRNRIKRAGKGETTDRQAHRRPPLAAGGLSTRFGRKVSHRPMPSTTAALERAEPLIITCGNFVGRSRFSAIPATAHIMMYPLNLPADDCGKVKRILQWLSSEFSDEKVTIDTAVFNPARIWKLPGTLVCKGDHTPERPHRYARIISTTEAGT